MRPGPGREPGVLGTGHGAEWLETLYRAPLGGDDDDAGAGGRRRRGRGFDGGLNGLFRRRRLTKATGSGLSPRDSLGGRPCVLATGLLIALSGLVAACGPTEVVSAELRVEWRAGEGFGGQVTVHESLPGQPQGETLTYGADEEPRIGAEILDAVLRPKMGSVAKFVFVVRNPTDKPLRFWVTPHLPVPYSAERGLVIHCLCTSQQYEIPPRGSWTRVIEVGLNPEAGTRGPVVITHAFIEGDVPSAD